MKVLVLIVILISSLLLCGAQETDSYLPRPAPPPNNCSLDRIREIHSRMDPLCGNNSERLADIMPEAVHPHKHLSPAQAKEMADLIEEVCSDRCGGTIYQLYTECFPTDIEMELSARMYAGLCGSNGHIRCGLLPLHSRNDKSYQHYAACAVQSAAWPDRCPTGCKEAFEGVINEHGCCTTNLFDDLFSYLANGTATEFFSLCEIEDPGFCTVLEFTDTSRDLRVVATNKVTVFLLLLMAALFAP